MIKTTKRDLQKSIAHWERMLAWAEKQPKIGRVSAYDMGNAINESWYADDCALCVKINFEVIETCAGCILFGSGYGCREEESSPWAKIDNSKTWGTWCENARKFIAIMKGLL